VNTEKQVSISGFLSLSVMSGITIGMARIVTQLFAIDIGADAFQIGVITAAESVGMMLLTVPAGFIIARHGARFVYAVASLGPLLLNLVIPLFSIWWVVALMRLLIGICIPFRTVSMNSAFLEQLKRIGDSKAGWYRGSFTLGISVLGPAVATFITGRTSYFWGFVVIAALFGVMALFSLSFFPEGSKVDAIPARASPYGQISGLLRQRDVAESCAIEFASNATSSLYATFILLVAASLPGLTVHDGVNVVLLDGVVTLVALFLGADVLRRLERRRAYLAGFAISIAGLCIASAAHGFAGLAIGGMSMAAAAALVHLVNMILLSRLPGDKSKVAGVYQLSQMLGSITGAFAGGVLGKFMPVQLIFLAWVPILVLMCLPIWLFGGQSDVMRPLAAAPQDGEENGH